MGIWNCPNCGKKGLSENETCQCGCSLEETPSNFDYTKNELSIILDEIEQLVKRARELIDEKYIKK